MKIEVKEKIISLESKLKGVIKKYKKEFEFGS